jgi:hypothetical protein
MTPKSYFFNPAEDRMRAAGAGLGLPVLTTAERTGLTMSTGDRGMLVWDQDLAAIFYWNGSAWVQITSGGGSPEWPEVFPVGVTIPAPPIGLLATTNTSFAFPAPTFTGGSPYSGMRIDFHDIVQLDMTIGASGAAAGVYEFNFYHAYQITNSGGALAALPYFIYCKGSMGFNYAPAGFAIPNFKVVVRGSVEIPAEVFTPDGVDTINFDDTVAGTGYFVDDNVAGVIPFSINPVNCFLYGQRITAHYIYGIP